jgi:hypothetical protein
MQGDILRDVKFSDWDWDAKKKDIIIYEKELPYIVILTQDCDLEWDSKYRTTTQKNDDKKLQSILVCPAYGESNSVTPIFQVIYVDHKDGRNSRVLLVIGTKIQI